MAFKITKEPRFTREVTVREPVDGGYAHHSFQATFRLLDADDLAEHDYTTPDGMAAFLQTILIGADDILDDQDKPVPYSDALRDQLIAFVPSRNAIFDAYIAAVADARMGNSGRQGAPG